MYAYTGSYLSATTTYAGANSDGSYGLFVSNSNGPGVISHTYASNMSDSGYYIGACTDCNATLDDAHAQYSALGYSGTNSGGHLVIENSEFDHNKTGFSTNSQNNDDAPVAPGRPVPEQGRGADRHPFVLDLRAQLRARQQQRERPRPRQRRARSRPEPAW